MGEQNKPADAASNSAPATKKKYYPHKKVIHGGTVHYPDGTPLPADFPSDQVDRLLKSKVIGEAPPSEGTREAKPKLAPAVDPANTGSLDKPKSDDK